MAAIVRSVDFLPEIFQTPVNTQFLNATLDQLIQEPQYKQTQGYIGQKVGPGVNPNDYYVVEPTPSRTNYQLEPGVVVVDPTTTKVSDAITYPGMLDAIRTQGGIIDQADRLFESEYYAWDPFVDFDKFNNYAQYYWLPNGPDVVTVSATDIPIKQTFTVTRANGAYTFSGYAGENPTLTLVRNGNYNFNIAQTNTNAVDYRVTNNGTRFWTIDFENNPTLTLIRGNTYTWNLVQNLPLSFYIKTELSFGTTNIWSEGVTNNGAKEGLVTFTVPQDAPDTLYYCNDIEFNLRGQLNIVDATPGTGPDFWIQSEPGINGRLSWSPNISSRDVLGVTNNGIDLGTVAFAVPDKSAQNFYYSMPFINYPAINTGRVNLVIPSTLLFNQINGITVQEFLATYPTGIDGVTNLNGFTCIFSTQTSDPAPGGWYIESPFDSATVNGQPGSFDNISFSQQTPITDPAIQFGLWQIQYVPDANGVEFIQLNSILTIDNLTQFSITAGTKYVNTQWYKNSSGFFQEMPLLTAALPNLYYQDSEDPKIFGIINLIDENLNATINVATDILGQLNYTSPNGVTFTNGLKIIFRGNVIPESYQDNTYYVQGVGSGIVLVPEVSLIVPEQYATEVNVINVYDASGNGTEVTLTFLAQPTLPFAPGQLVIVSKIVSSIGNYNGVYTVTSATTSADKLFQSITYASTADGTYISGGTIDSYGNQPIAPDYITINMASQDLNPWTRSNRWFHTEVIMAAAAYNNTAPAYSAERATRPILEFRANTKLFDFAIQGIPAVNVIDFTQTDALLNVNGQIGYGTDGYTLVQGSLIIFAADLNPDVKNQIYEVTFVDVDPTISLTPVIILVPTSYSPALPNQGTVCLSGNTQKGQSFYFTGTSWIASQQKTSVQQPPLFDVYNAKGYSFGDTTQYPSTNFTGCKLLSYAENPDNPIDKVLGIPLAFFSINNIGDTLFNNNFYTDTFIYTPAGVGITVDVSSGFVYQYNNLVSFTPEIGWQTAAIPSLQRQQFQFKYSGNPLQLDVLAATDLNVPAVQIFINNVYQLPSTYVLSVNSTTGFTVITLTGTTYIFDDIIEVLVYSSDVSSIGFYQIPINLENNPFNGNSKQFTLGGIRQHYATICENLLALQGNINGPNNTRDLGNIVPYGTQIVQQSSPLTLGGFFLRSASYDIFSSIEYNSREYIKYKNKLLTAVTQLDIQPSESISSILDAAIQKFTSILTNANSFYWSDMLPAGTNYTPSTTIVNPITTNIFNTLQTYDFTTSNYQGLLVYVNGVLLLRGSQYTVSTIAPKLTILIKLNVGDVVVINEYIPVLTTTTAGTTSTNPGPSWCPNTPSKMGLYPVYQPQIYLDDTYSSPTLVIQGHDGSTTIAFGDIRDQVLLEFEKRIYNNIKVDDNPIPLTTDEVNPNFYPAQTTALLPGFFRTTPYTYAEVNQIMNEDFLTWVGQNKLDFTSQDYIASNPFTYNYSQAANRINQEPFLQGNWRGIYRYFYDTETPNSTPWEMVGFSQEPSWWMQRYGPAPYTSGNTVLWDDLEAGIVGDPSGPYILPEYVRPGLSKIIPAGSEGELLSPLDCVVGLNDPYGFQKSWTAGDGGPVQASWWNSSSYPFAIMRLLALTKPAQFFSLFADRDLYRYNTTLGQYLYNNRYRLNASEIQIYGNGVSKASYINWIVDYNNQLGIDSTTTLTEALANIDVRLCYRMAAFSDPVYVALSTDRAGPSSTNNSLLIPPTSYDLLFYKNQPFNSVTYSSVIVQVEELSSGGIGYSVYGYSNVQPYFEALASIPAGSYQVISAGGTSVQVPIQRTNNIVQIPYGYTFTSTASVCDFLLGYGAWLMSQGLMFDNIENGYALTWNQMCQEFLYFSSQGWTPGTIINLNPCATKITASQPISIVDTIASVTPENMLLDQNRSVLNVSTMIVNREGNQFSVTSTSGQTINYLTLKYTNYEDMIVLNNTSQYQDLIYDPLTGSRQVRLSLIASTTTNWDGQLNAQGFILNLNNVKQWQPNKTYAKGEMVLYKNTYWQALVISQPQQAFNYSNWIKSDYQKIDTGLLPNLANKANQLTTAYDVYQANLTSDNDLFAFALIGFRPRQYMTDMNLNGVTQVQIYQQFLATKGTLQAAEIFNNAQINSKEKGDYQIYENWGVLSGTYGAQANKSYFEIQLNQSLLSYNPSTIQIINPGQSSQANQTVYLNNLWKESYSITSTNILPTTYENSSLAVSLPSAGYVCLDDVDVTVFNIEDPSSIDAQINTIGIGTYIWIAKINSYDWGVYRVAETPGEMLTLTDNLNNTAIAQMTRAHGLSIGDLIIIKYFNQGVNGVYRILAIPTPTSFTISFNFSTLGIKSLTGTGLVFHLQSARVSQASDISTLPFVNNLLEGSIAWVDNDGNGHWKTLQKQSPFVINQSIIPGITADGQYGVSIAQVGKSFGAIVGASGTNSGAGSVLTYIRGTYTDYLYSGILTLLTQGTVGFGNMVEFGNQNWAVAGASASYSNMGYAAVIYRNSTDSSYTINQLLLPPDQNFGAIGFGTSAVISTDERWMYIGAPKNNLVYAYEKIEVETQSVTYTGDSSTTLFNYSNYIQINYLYPEQLVITFGNVQISPAAYTLTQQYVSFNQAPAAGQIITITRRSAIQLDQSYYYAIQSNSQTGAGVGAVFTVENTRGSYYVTLNSGGLNYQIGDVLTIYGTQIGGTNPANNLTITVVNVITDGVITAFTTSGSGLYNVNSFSLNTYLYNATTINNFTVSVNGTLQRPYFDYTFNTGTTILTFLLGSYPPKGAKIVVSTPTYWQYVTTITNPASLSGDNFGASVSTTGDGRQIVITAPNSTTNMIVDSGSAYVFDRSVAQFVVSDPAQLTYTISGAINPPIAVSVNNIFLLTTEQSISGQYTLNGNSVIFSNITFNYGDVIEIETNQINQIQALASHTPSYEAQYGTVAEIGPLDNNLFVGAPFDSTYLAQSGSVDYLTNQSRVYGITTSTIANPILTSGGTIRINGAVITVPPAPNNNVIGLAATINAADVPNVFATVTSDLTFTGDGSNKVFYIGNLYSVASSYNTVVYVNNILQIAGTDYSYDPTTESIYFLYAPQAGYFITVVSGRLTISIKNSKVGAINNLLTVLPGFVNSVFAQIGFNTFVFSQQILSPAPTVYGQFGASLSVDTGGVNLIVGSPNGNVYEPTTFDAGQTYFDEHSTTFFNGISNGGVAYTYDYFPSSTNNVNNPGQFAFGQQIYNSYTSTGSRFATAVNYDNDRLIVGATGGVITNTTNLGYITVYNNPTDLPAWVPIRVQQPVVDVYALDGVFVYNGAQAIGVNNTLNGGIQTYFDFFDPLQGKILGVARSNLDYIGAVDPAQYNVGSVHNNGNAWGSEHIGEMWWDIDTVRFIDPNQDDIVYASRRWGTTFPGSSVDVYQWVESSNPPGSYTGQGTPLGPISYTVNSVLGTNNIFQTLYYFWVKGITTIASGAGKTLSANGVASYIFNPRSSGLPYIAGLNASTVAIYNAQNLLNANNTILSIGFDRQINDDVVHQEYQIITDGIADSFLNTQLYRKFLDSLTGQDTAGNAVPDPTLSPGMKYGVEFRPRQSMFAKRFTALENYLGRANVVLAQFPISEIRSFNLLNAVQPTPAAGSGAWNFSVPNLTILGYQNLALVPVGYKYLVLSDSSQQGRWTIYQVQSDKTLMLIQVQSYNTPLYWYYVNWYLTGYNPTIPAVAAVQNFGQLSSLTYTTAPVGSSVRVISNGAGKWEIYLRTGLNPAVDWQRVGLEDGTIAFKEELWNYKVGNFGFDAQVFDSQYFDETPQVETRYILRALNEEIYIEDLLYERNSSLILMFNYVYSEFTNPSWLVKTSYVNVNHAIRSLAPYQTYLPDNQQFVMDYFQEVKPYHVQVRKFNLIYNGKDEFDGDLTDFDLPAYWKSTLEIPQFISPILTPYDTAVTTHYSTASDTPSNAQIWLYPSLYSEWFNNYLLSVESVAIANRGAGYTVNPVVTVTGTCTTPATMTANINGSGEVVAITVINPGAGYSTDATITISGGGLPGVSIPWSAGLLVNSNSYIITRANDIYRTNNTGVLGNVAPIGTGTVVNGAVALTYAGTNATAVAYMGNGLVRSIKTTIKYDRYQYQTDIIDWAPTQLIIVLLANITTSGGTATATFVTEQMSVPFPDENIITVTGVSVTGFNGDYTVLSCSSTNLTFATNFNGVGYNGQVTGTVLVTYTNGTQVRYRNQVWQANGISGSVTNSIFDPAEWVIVDPATLSGVDRTMGYYVATTNIPGLSLPLLIDGIDYPGVQVAAVTFNQDTGYDRGNYDINTFDNYGLDANGQPTYDYGILNTIFESQYLDPYLGVRPTDINIDGGAYVDTYESHAPEELVPGIEFDTLDFRVYTTPGADWAGVGHGFPQHLFQTIYNSSQPTTSFAGQMPYPITIGIVNVTRGYDLLVGIDYTVNWPNQTFTILNSSALVVNGDQIAIYVYELGGGNQLYKNTYNGGSVGNTITVPVEYEQIQEFVIFINGVYLNNSNYNFAAGTAYGTTVLTFDTTYTSSDFISLVVIAPTTINNITTNYSWSVPVVQNIVGVTGVLTYSLDNSLLYTNSVNPIVTVQGIRARTAAGIDFLASGAQYNFLLPQRLGVPLNSITSADVQVYINDELQNPSTWYLELGTYTEGYATTLFDIGFSTNHPGSYNYSTLVDALQVVFYIAPTEGQRVYIAVTAGSQAIIDPVAKTVTFNSSAGLVPITGATISVTTFNDTREQRLLTQVFVGPVEIGVIIEEGFDIVGFDSATVPNTSGSFNYTVGSTIAINDLNLTRFTPDIDRLKVFLNGKQLTPYIGFTVEGTQLILGSGTLQPTDIVMVTQVTNSVVPEAMAFRIFQDMRGVQATYRITANTTTTLTQAVEIIDDVIYVDNASALSEPDFAANIWGVITINGERIMYRDRDTVANTVSSLLRGTAGTGADAHEVGSNVYDMGRGNLLATQFQDYIVSNTILANGATTVFIADNISLAFANAVVWNYSNTYDQGTIVVNSNFYYRAIILVPTSIAITNTEYWLPLSDAVEVIVGGTLQTTGYTITAENPVQVTFNFPPAAGLDVTIFIRRGVTWYQQGVSTASNGVPLQETETVPALFLRGVN